MRFKVFRWCLPIILVIVIGLVCIGHLVVSKSARKQENLIVELNNRGWMLCYENYSVRGEEPIPIDSWKTRWFGPNYLQPIVFAEFGHEDGNLEFDDFRSIADLKGLKTLIVRGNSDRPQSLQAAYAQELTNLRHLEYVEFDTFIFEKDFLRSLFHIHSPKIVFRRTNLTQADLD